MKAITDQNFEVETNEGLVIVDFWAPWCGPCRIQQPILEELGQELEGKVKVTKINVDENPSAPQEHGIMGIPTMIIKKDGEIVEKLVGVHTKEIISDILNRYL